MSMLTPPGMGGKYRITGNQYPRMRQPRNHRRFVLAAAAAVAVVGLIGWGTMQLIHVFGGRGGGTHTNAARAPHCAPGGTVGQGGTGALPKPGAVTVNVYNATQRGGLAKSTADELKKRGFAIGKVGNAPAAYDKKVKGAAILLGGAKAQNALKVLGTQVTGADVKTDPARPGASDVDLVIGDGFSALAPQQNADQSLAALAHPAPAASGSGRGC